MLPGMLTLLPLTVAVLFGLGASAGAGVSAVGAGVGAGAGSGAGGGGGGGWLAAPSASPPARMDAVQPTRTGAASAAPRTAIIKAELRDILRIPPTLAESGAVFPSYCPFTGR